MGLKFCNEQELINLEKGQPIKVYYEYPNTSMLKIFEAVVEDNSDGEVLKIKQKNGEAYSFEYISIVGDHFELPHNLNLKVRISKIERPSMSRYRFMNQ